MRPVHPVLLVLASAACATAGSPSSDDARVDPVFDAAPDENDGKTGDEADAMVQYDAGPVPVTLSQNTSDTVEAFSSLRCSGGDNRYFRVFDLAAMGVNGDLIVESVSFGVQTAVGNGGAQPVEIVLYTLSGEFVLANLTEVGSATPMVSDTTVSLETTPVSAAVAAGSKLVMEISVAEDPDNNFWLGANDDGQDNPPYVVWSSCGHSEPTDLTTVDGGETDTSLVHYIMSVSGTAQP